MDAPRTTKDHAKALRRRLSLPEGLLWRAIKGRKLKGLHFRKQHPIGPYVLDFYCQVLRLAVEVDGSSHDFDERPQRDERRDAWVAAQGIVTLRLSAALILEDVDDATRSRRHRECPGAAHYGAISPYRGQSRFRRRTSHLRHHGGL